MLWRSVVDDCYFRLTPCGFLKRVVTSLSHICVLCWAYLYRTTHKTQPHFCVLNGTVLWSALKVYLFICLSIFTDFSVVFSVLITWASLSALMPCQTPYKGGRAEIVQRGGPQLESFMYWLDFRSPEWSAWPFGQHCSDYYTCMMS